MNKDTYNNYAFNIFIIIIFLFIIFILLFNSPRSSNFEINVLKDDERIINFTDLELIPGVDSKYNITLNCPLKKELNVELMFTEIKTSLFRNFLYTKIIVEEDIIYEGLLSDLLNNRLIFTKVVNKSEPLVIKVVYCLDKDVGNEIMNQEIEIDLVVKVRSA